MNNYRYIKILLLLFHQIFILSFNYAQNIYTQTIRGTVVDKISQMPLPGATIIVVGSDPIIGTTSNEKGIFRISNLPIGRYSLQISFMGYNTATLSNLELTSAKELVLQIELEERIITTSEVVITAEQRKDKAINEMAVISSRSFSVEETNRYAGSWGDPARMAANFAGVMSVTDQRNDIIIRGNSPIGVLWRLDECDIPNPNHFGAMGTTGGPISILNNNLLTNSDFISGAFPAEYGNALAGVFDLKLRNGNNEKYEHMVQCGFNGLEVGSEGPLSKQKNSSYIANFRYATLKLFNAIGMDFGTNGAIPQYRDGSFKLNFPTKKFGKISIFGIGGHSYITFSDDNKDSTKLTYGLSGTHTDYGSAMGVIGITHTLFLNEKTRLITNLSGSLSQNYIYIDSIAYATNTRFQKYRSNLSEKKLTHKLVLLEEFYITFLI